MNRYALSRVYFLGTSGVVYRLAKTEMTFASQDFAPTLFPGLWRRRVDGLFHAILPSDVVTDASLGPGDSLLLFSVVANIIGFHLRPRSSSTRQSDPKEKIEIDITS